jgi:hypothetical protein
VELGARQGERMRHTLYGADVVSAVSPDAIDRRAQRPM